MTEQVIKQLFNRTTATSKYLRGMHPYAKNIETAINILVENIGQITTGTKEVSHDYTQLSAAFALFGASFDGLIDRLNRLAGENETLRNIIRTSFSNQIANAIMVCEHLGILNSGDPYWLADVIGQIQDEKTIKAAIGHIKKSGSEEDQKRLEWFREAITTKEKEEC